MPVEAFRLPSAKESPTRAARFKFGPSNRMLLSPPSRMLEALNVVALEKVGVCPRKMLPALSPDPLNPVPRTKDAVSMRLIPGAKVGAVVGTRVAVGAVVAVAPVVAVVVGTMLDSDGIVPLTDCPFADRLKVPVLFCVGKVPLKLKAPSGAGKVPLIAKPPFPVRVPLTG